MKAKSKAEELFANILGIGVIVGLCAWGMVSCSEPKTEEEVKASVVREYLEHCKRNARWFEVHEAGGVQKYKDYSYGSALEMQRLLRKNPWLDVNACEKAQLEGRKEAFKLIRNGRVDMRN